MSLWSFPLKPRGKDRKTRDDYAFEHFAPTADNCKTKNLESHGDVELPHQVKCPVGDIGTRQHKNNIGNHPRKSCLNISTFSLVSETQINKNKFIIHHNSQTPNINRAFPRRIPSLRSSSSYYFSCAYRILKPKV